MRQRSIGARERHSLGSERTAAVLASAIRVFAARGFEAADLSEIARETGMSLPSLEQEFGGKEDLFRRAVGEVARGQVARACRELPPGSAVEQLWNFCGRSWDILHAPTQAALYRLWVTEAPRDPDLARFYVEEVYRPIHGVLVGIINRGIAAGQFRTTAPGATARVLMAALVEQAFWCNHAEAFGPAVGGSCNRVIAETLSVLLGGLQPPSQDSTS